MLLGHGGNFKNGILDFSVSINPLGISPKLSRLILCGLNLLKAYPDPECSLAKEALSRHWKIEADNFLLGNGSNELIHLLPKALKPKRILIYQPAFSEYELSAKLSGARIHFLFADEKEGFHIDVKKIIPHIPKADLIFLCNPNNPTGNLLKKEPLIELAKACQKNKTYLVIDEVFMDFVDNEEGFSLLKYSVKNKYLLILRSFTKFFSLPGLRIGYLVGEKETIKKMALFQPTWSVNSLAQEVVKQGLNQPAFIAQTKKYIKEEKELFFNRLKEIKGIRPYYPNANFIFCKILKKGMNSRELFLRLIKSGIAIRDCQNFKGLDSAFFRIAVRRRKDNLYLIQSLKKILQ